MKGTNILAIVFILCGANALQPYASAQTNDRRCNNRLIHGTYGFTIEGQKLAGPGPVGPQVGVAITTFDGEGNLSQVDSIVIGGSLVADFTHPPASGTYSVDANCTGTFTIEFRDGRPPVTVDFVVVDDGREIDTVVTPPPGVVGPLATRSIGKRRFGLLGSFATSAFGPQQMPSQLAQAQDLNDQGQFRAVVSLLQPLTRDEQTLSSHNRGIAWNILGSAYESLEDFGQARRCYERSLSILKGLPPPQAEYASTLNNLGSLERMHGNSQAARKLWLRARDVYEAAGRHGSLAVIANNLSLLDLTQKDIRAAQREVTEAFRQAALAEPFKDNDYAAMYTTKGSVADAEGDLKGAIAAYDKAIEIWTRDHGKGFYMVGAGYALRGAEFEKLGDSARAIEDLKLALTVLEDTIGKSTNTYLRVETHYARVLRRTGAKEEASCLDKEVKAAMATVRRQQCNGCAISAEIFQ